MGPRRRHYTDRTGGVESITKYGRAAAPSDESAVTAVKSYYVTLSAPATTPVACSLLSPSLRASMTQSFGRARALGVCEKALMVVFGSRPGAGFSPAITVTGVRVKGDRAFALISTQPTPSGVIDMEREHGAWRVGSVAPFRLGPGFLRPESLPSAFGRSAGVFTRA